MTLIQLPTATSSWFSSERMVETSTTTVWFVLLLFWPSLSLILLVVAAVALAGNFVLRINCARRFRYSCTQPEKRILDPLAWEDTLERRTRVAGRGRKEEGSVVEDIMVNLDSFLCCVFV
jgi:hypothetical protein